jgi:hypothetical protein
MHAYSLIRIIMGLSNALFSAEAGELGTPSDLPLTL